MSQADALLASLEDIASPHEHSMVDPDNYFIIDPDTRLISNIAQAPNVLMQNDHNSEIYTFAVPRVVEGHDMRQCNRIWLHFINTETGGRRKHEDAVELTAVADVKNETLTSKWLITRHATQYVGNLSFLLQYLCVNDSGEITYEWHTDIYSDVTIKKTFDNGQAATVEYTHILEDWYQKLFNTEDSMIADITDEVERQKAVITAKGAEVLATIPDEYTDLSVKANQAIRTRANAIQHTASGEAIIATDCSDDYLRGLKIFGKTTQATSTGAQMFDKDAVVSGLLETDGSVVADGAYVTSDYIPVTPRSTYYQTQKDSVRGKFYDADKNPLSDIWDTQLTTEGSFDTPENAYFFRTTISTAYVNVFMLNEGSVGLPYEPYTAGEIGPTPTCPMELNHIEQVDVRISGANLCNLPNMTVTVINGVTWQYKDGYAIANGTATAQSNVQPGTCPLNLLPGQYTVSGGNNGVSVIVARHRGPAKMYFTSKNGGYVNFGVESGDKLYLYTQVGNTASVSNATVYPVVNAGTNPLDWERYKLEQTISLAKKLRGISVDHGGNCVDASGQEWFSDEIDFERGVYIQRFTTVTYDGDENWAYYSSGDGVNQFYTIADNCYTENTLTNAMSPQLKSTSVSNRSYNYNTVYTAAQGIYKYVCVNVQGFASASEFKTYLNMNPISITYRLETPVEIPLTDDELFAFSQLHSNCLITTVANSQNGCMEVKYNADTAAFLEQAQGPSDEQVERYVNAWLERYFVDAEGVSF